MSRPVRWLIVGSCVWSLAVPLAFWWFDLDRRLELAFYQTIPIGWKVWAFPLILAWFGFFIWKRLNAMK